MKKPIAKHHHEPAYSYLELQKWIEKKTGRSLTDWAGSHGADRAQNLQYQNFWHWLIDSYHVNNGSYFELECDPETTAYIAAARPAVSWVKEILDIINAEFPEAEGRLFCYVSW